jgi:hypothetical protein
MQVKNRMAWEKFRASYSGQKYERGILDFAERWAKRMETRVAAGGKVEDIAEAAIVDPVLRLTSLQLAEAIIALVAHWERGEELRRWYDEQWPAVKARRGE